MGILLLSNGKQPGMGLLEHAKEWIPEHFTDGGRILFVPYAKADRDYDGYEKAVAGAMEPMGFSITSAHRYPNAVSRLKEFDGIFIGGGNTFCLLDKLIKGHWLKPIADAVGGGCPIWAQVRGLTWHAQLL